MKISTIYGIIGFGVAIAAAFFVFTSDNTPWYDTDTWQDYDVDHIGTISVGDELYYTFTTSYGTSEVEDLNLKVRLTVKSISGDTYTVSNSETGETQTMTKDELLSYVGVDAYIKANLSSATLKSQETTTIKTGFGKRNVYKDTYLTSDRLYSKVVLWYGENGVLYKVDRSGNYDYEIGGAKFVSIYYDHYKLKDCTFFT